MRAATEQNGRRQTGFTTACRVISRTVGDLSPDGPHLPVVGELHDEASSYVSLIKSAGSAHFFNAVKAPSSARASA